MENIFFLALVVLGFLYHNRNGLVGTVHSIRMDLPKEPMNQDLLYKLERIESQDSKIASRLKVAFICVAVMWLIYSMIVSEI